MSASSPPLETHCPECHRTVAVLRSGVLRDHGFARRSYVVATAAGPAVVCGRFPCPGSGRRPGGAHHASMPVPPRRGVRS